MSDRSDHDADETVCDAAITWLIRVQSDAATEADWAALTDWLEASEAHQAAFDEVEQMSAQIDQAATPLLAALTRPPADVIVLKPRTKPHRVWLAPPAIAAGFAVAAVVLAPPLWRAYQGQPTTFVTAVGQTRAVRLADGTQIQLDAASRLTVRLGWRQRQVTMGDGEASFDVAKDPGHPFVIAAGDQTIRVVGTQFNVRHYDGTLEVTVRRGVVEIDQPDVSAQPVARLTKGWRLSHVDGAPRSLTAQVNPDRAFAWTEGRLICDDRSLSEIVAYLNRRYPTQIRLSAAAARKSFTGVLQLGDQGDVVRALSGYLALTAHRSGGEIILS